MNCLKQVISRKQQENQTEVNSVITQGLLQNLNLFLMLLHIPFSNFI